MLAKLIVNSKNFIAYTGAGISTSLGIGDYASRSAGDASAVASLTRSPAKSSPYAAEPTQAHYCLTALHRAGHLKWWCQQNHDGLPQKAGMPQRAMNEIHGSWWDPSNPVIPMSGSLRDDLFADLRKWEDRSDLCLAVGTSLSGMNADRLVERCGQRADEDPSCLGSVIIGYQCTRLDSIASLRVYSSIEKTMVALAAKMDLILHPKLPPRSAYVYICGPLYENEAPALTDSQPKPIQFASGCIIADDVYEFRGYDPHTGERSEAGSVRLYLRVDDWVRVTSGMLEGTKGKVVGKTTRNNYKIEFLVSSRQKPRKVTKWPVPITGADEQEEIVCCTKMLGGWMLEFALDGDALYLPLLNCDK